jgi:hypothetical protein
MTLVDVANGRNRHVPYRDSRLTFLLQVKIQKKKSMLLNVFLLTVSIFLSPAHYHIFPGFLRREL